MLHARRQRIVTLRRICHHLEPVVSLIDLRSGKRTPSSMDHHRPNREAPCEEKREGSFGLIAILFRRKSVNTINTINRDRILHLL